MVIRNTIEQTVMLELLPRSEISVYVQVGGAWARSGHSSCLPCSPLAMQPPSSAAGAGRCQDIPSAA
jgi:ribonuclease PH